MTIQQEHLHGSPLLQDLSSHSCDEIKGVKDFFSWTFH